MDWIINWWQIIQPTIVSKGLQLIVAVIIFFIGRKVINLCLKLLQRLMEKSNWEATVCSFAYHVIKAILYIVLALILLECIGYEMTSLAALLASAGVAVGLALQGSLSNLAGGILILLMKPFQIGDYISAGVYAGTVREIGLVYTVLVTVDGKTIVVPNGTLSANTIENFSTQENRRVDVRVGISYSADLKKAKEVFRKEAEAIPQRLEDQPLDIFVSELADSAVILEGRVWVSNADYFPVLWALTENIKLAFDREGIEIPFSQVDVHLVSKGQEIIEK